MENLGKTGVIWQNSCISTALFVDQFVSGKYKTLFLYISFDVYILKFHSLDFIVGKVLQYSQ